jgi:hypothetical protein
VAQGGLDQWPVDAGQVLADAVDLEGGEALLGRAAVLLEMLGDQAVDEGALLGVEVAAVEEPVGEAARRVATLRAEGAHELVLVDQAILQGQQPKEQASRRVDASRHDCQLPLDPTRIRSVSVHSTERRGFIARPGLARRGMAMKSPCYHDRPLKDSA